MEKPKSSVSRLIPVVTLLGCSLMLGACTLYCHEPPPPPPPRTTGHRRRRQAMTMCRLRRTNIRLSPKTKRAGSDAGSFLL